MLCSHPTRSSRCVNRNATEPLAAPAALSLDADSGGTVGPERRGGGGRAVVDASETDSAGALVRLAKKEVLVVRGARRAAAWPAAVRKVPVRPIHEGSREETPFTLLGGKEVCDPSGR